MRTHSHTRSSSLMVAVLLSSFLCKAESASAGGFMIVSARDSHLAINAWDGAVHGTVLRLHNSCQLSNPDCTWTYRNGMLLSDRNPSLAINAWDGAAHGTVLRLHNGCVPTNPDCTWTYRGGMWLSNRDPSLAINAWGGAAHGTTLRLNNSCQATNPDCTWTISPPLSDLAVRIQASPPPPGAIKAGANADGAHETATVTTTISLSQPPANAGPTIILPGTHVLNPPARPPIDFAVGVALSQGLHQVGNYRSVPAGLSCSFPEGVCRGSLAVGQSFELMFDVIADARLAPPCSFTGTVTIEANPDQAISELSETNNAATTPINVESYVNDANCGSGPLLLQRGAMCQRLRPDRSGFDELGTCAPGLRCVHHRTEYDHGQYIQSTDLFCE